MLARLSRGHRPGAAEYLPGTRRPKRTSASTPASIRQAEPVIGSYALQERRTLSGERNHFPIRLAAAGRPRGSARASSVVGPARSSRAGALRALGSPDELLLEGFVRPANSIKEFVFPQAGRAVRLSSPGQHVEMTRRRCPAAGTDRDCCAALRRGGAADPRPVFNWDFKDEFYNRRRAADDGGHAGVRRSRRPAASARRSDSVPAAERGSDVMLFELGRRQLRGPLPTRKRPAPCCRQDRSGRKRPAGRRRAGEEVRSRRRCGAFSREHFEDPFWPEHAPACLGCGACAYTCPTCHCFDIVDDGPARAGPACAELGRLPVRHVHAPRLGPQPAERQAQRQRQRIYHKFRIYPREVRRDALHRLRQLHAELPGRPGRAPCSRLAGDRSTSMTPTSTSPT